MPLSQHRNATLIIVILWRQTVKLYEKASFVLYSTDLKYTSLRLSDTKAGRKVRFRYLLKINNNIYFQNQIRNMKA